MFSTAREFSRSRLIAIAAPLALAAVLALSGIVSANVISLSINSPTNADPAEVFSGDNVDVSITFTENHICGPYRSIITIGTEDDQIVQQINVYEPGVHIRPVVGDPDSDLGPCLDAEPSNPYTFVHTLNIPAGTPAGAYNLIVQVQENWLPGSSNWGFALNRTEYDAILVGLVDVDIKPGSDPNSVNLNSRGVLPVAILGSDLLDVSEIDVNSVNIGGVGVAERGRSGQLHASLEDVNGDGNLDLVVHFRIQDLVDAGVLDADTEYLVVDAELNDGTAIQGSDAVNIVP